jgi:hypothetical protein
VSNLFINHRYIDETTGKYKTNKCTIDFFQACAARHGIDISEQLRDGMKERVIAGSGNVIDYVKVIKEMHLRINQQPDENTSTKSYAGRL